MLCYVSILSHLYILFFALLSCRLCACSTVYRETALLRSPKVISSRYVVCIACVSGLRSMMLTSFPGVTRLCRETGTNALLCLARHSGEVWLHIYHSYLCLCLCLLLSLFLFAFLCIYRSRSVFDAFWDVSASISSVVKHYSYINSLLLRYFWT